jgi:hypothetical protein
MDKDFYKDLEKIKTIGSTYMAAVGLAPTAGTRVSSAQGHLLQPGPALPQVGSGTLGGSHAVVGVTALQEWGMS